MRAHQTSHLSAGDFKTVFIVGGTHGNEKTGVMLVRGWQQDPAPVQRKAFATQLLVANPEAVRTNTRFVDQDLNRSFRSGQPGEAATEPYEVGRAREISERMAAARERGKVFAIDLHTSTANMGRTLITNTDPVNLTLAAHVKAHDPAVRIYAFPPGDRIDNCLRAAADGGVGLEIGPIPQGVLRHDVLQIAAGGVKCILDVLEAHAQGELPPPDPRTKVFLHEAHTYYPAPRDASDAVCVHRDLQDRDFMHLAAGAPIFTRLNGETIHYQGPPGRCPVFINEAAYYHERIAFSMVRPVALHQLMN
ncbi:MAG: aspartoacylase [Desulfobacterales bacterium]|nr:aspartoacylase [Desulfobacterales bacterium]MDJ0875503.1 aspartoacylase [Desulfobacterales bacterium]